MCSPPRCCRFQPVTHCIFALDGLLLDTEDIYIKACQRVLEEHNKVLTEEVKIRCRGLSTQQLAAFIIRTYKLKISSEEYLHRQNDFTMQLICNPELLPGVERLIKHLAAYKVPMAIATMSNKATYESKTRFKPDIFQLFKHAVCAGSDEDVKHRKPAPDIFLVTAKRFCDSPNPESCLVFEDSPNGVWAANEAGMQVVMVPYASMPCIFQQDATTVLESLLEFQPEDFCLPPFR